MKAVPISYNASRLSNNDGTVSTTFHAGWSNTLDNNGLWVPIDLGIKEDSTSFSTNKTPYSVSAPKRSGGDIRFEDSSKYDEKTSKSITSAPVGKTKNFIGTNDVAGEITNNGVLYRNAYSFADILIQPFWTGVKNLVVFNSEPAGISDIEIPFMQTVDSGVSVETNDSKNKRIQLKNIETDSGKGISFIKKEDRKFFTRPAYAWDSAGKTIPIRVMTSVIGNTISARKIIPRSFLSSATYPVYTDTSDVFTANTNDQGLATFNAAWADTYNGVGAALESISRTSHILTTWTNSGYGCYTAFLWWATGATIPSGDVISSASLYLRVTGNTNGHNQDFYLVENRQASTSLATSDWANVGASGIGTGTNEPYASWTAVASGGAEDRTLTINSTGQTKIAKGSGNTFYTLCSADWWTNTTPVYNDTNTLNVASADNATSSYRPQLTVVHAPEAAKGGTSLLLGV